MNALINETKKIKNKLKFSNLMTLFKQKIEDCIINDKAIVVNVSNSFMAFRNTMHIADYEIDDERLYLNDENFEIHLNLHKIKDIEYDNMYEECFILLHNDNTEIYFCFL